MNAVMCRGCTKSLSNCDTRIDILTHSLPTILQDNEHDDESHEGMIKLSVALELITGQPISKTDGLPYNLCTDCYRQLNAFIVFRKQLLRSLHKLLKLQLEEVIPESRSNVGNEGSAVEAKPSNNLNISASKELVEDLINVDEDSIPSDFGQSLQCLRNSSHTSVSEESLDQESNNLHESISSSENGGIICVRDSDKKYVDNDVESDIDVCSGDDDEVLELDVQSKKDVIHEIASSSESDVEVCDYKPIGKRFKSYGTLFPSLKF